MLFKNIAMVDDLFRYQENVFVGTIGDRIVYIGDTEPDKETCDALAVKYSKELADFIPKCNCHKPEHFHPVFYEEYDGTGKVLMPGFYNAHGHSPMCLMRGYGENLTLDRWLNDKIFPFEDKLNSNAVYWATLLTMAESLRFGIVSTSDMYYFTDDMVRAISVSGMKSNISRAVSSFDIQRLEDCVGYREMREAIFMYDGFQNGKILVEAAPHAEYTNNEMFIRAIADTAKEFDVRIHVHVAETKSETEGCIAKYGKTPVEFFADCGVFDVPANAAHCVWLTDNDRDILAEKGVSVSSNPMSNLKLASGMCDVPKLYEKGINVAIGTDSVASNNSLNFFEEMKAFALTGKIMANDPAVMTPQQVLRSATRAGALAQGREDCGLIKEGFKADLIVVDTSCPNMQPIHNVLNNLVYSADGKDVLLTMVDGEVLYRDGEYKNIDIEKTVAEAQKATHEILTLLS
ncbi:MAG: amidohydrolase [Mogibacterium sp.]|nr:amidohydrolase [Mogibacterium sp.]